MSNTKNNVVQKLAEYIGRNPAVTTIVIILYGLCITFSFTNLYEAGKSIFMIYSLVGKCAIVVILAFLSVLSIVFYFQYVTKIKEGTWGITITLIVVAGFAIILKAAADATFYSLITIGIFLLLGKSTQLWLLCKRKNIGINSRKYFFGYVVVYSITFIISFFVCYLLDTGKLAPPTKTHPQVEAINNTITDLANYSTSLKSKGINTLPLDSSINEINASFGKVSKTLYINSKNLYTSLWLIAIFICIILLVYMVMSFFNKKRVEKNRIFPELEKYSDGQERSNTTSMNVTLFTSLTILRPLVSFICGLISAAVFYFESAANMTDTLLLFFVVFLSTAYGFTINDCVDIEKDRINAPKRVLPLGILNKKMAIGLSISLFFLSVFTSLFLTSYIFGVNITVLFLLSIYSFINNRNGISANIITAICSSLVLLIGVSKIEINIATMTSICIFVFVLAREIIFDIDDIEGDKLINKTSIPITFGKMKSLQICDVLFVVFTISTITTSLLLNSYWYFIFIGIIANIILWYSYYIYKKDLPQSQQIFTQLTRLLLLLVIPVLYLTT